MKDFSEDSQKTLGRLSGDFSEAFLENFSDLRQILEDFWDNSWKTLGRLSKDSRKTLRRLLRKSSNAFYARRLPTKSSESLPKSSAQSGTKR
ncbi:hypothetical protein F2Q68_00008877 [Brassica cretica]|uniref:Uncharacterized protein n=1 Tax=Brassica cretica TaxID=69181 RepID=A0A8S9KSV9_BRACR|nr:hypothetical protein F2Q68_00008877 [Brassica cretica]